MNNLILESVHVEMLGEHAWLKLSLGFTKMPSISLLMKTSHAGMERSQQRQGPDSRIGTELSLT